MQTRVYLYAAAVAGGALAGGSGVVLPQRTNMVYWFTNAPDEMGVIGYSLPEMLRDQAWFASLTAEIAGMDDDGFVKTEDTRQCARCAYKPLCDRDDIMPEAGDDEAWTEEDLDLSLDALDGVELEF